MNTTAKGNEYEDKVLLLVKKLIADGTLTTGKSYSVHQKQSYPIDFGTDSFIADISIEVRNPHFNNEISNLIIFECKDLGTKLDKSDFEEWRGRLKNLPFGGKLYFVTRTGFSQPIITKAENSGIGLIVWSGEGEEKWIATRSLNELELRDFQFQLLRGENRSSFYPLIFEDGCFYTFGETLRRNNIPINTPTLKAPFIPRDKIKDIVNQLLINPEFYSIKTPNNEDKLITFLGVNIDFQELPESNNGKYDATNNVIILPNWLVSYPTRMRFSLAHELGHAFLHREKLKQFESFFDSKNNIKYNPTNAEIKWFDKQANDFASYLLMPDAQFRKAITLLFSQHGLHRFPFVIDNQKGKFPIYYSMVDSLAYQFQVSKEHVKSRLQIDKFVEITRQPNRIGNVIRGY